jgi:hypothetical protein
MAVSPEAAGVSRSLAERRALDALDVDGLVAFLRELIAIPSLDGRETPAQRRVAAWMEGAGLTTDVWPIDLDELSRHPEWCHEVEREEALGVVGWCGEKTAGRAAAGSGAGRDLLLNGTSTSCRAATRLPGRRRPGTRPSGMAGSTAAAPWT